MWNVIRLVQDLNSCHRVHIPATITITPRAPPKKGFYRALCLKMQRDYNIFEVYNMMILIKQDKNSHCWSSGELVLNTSEFDQICSYFFYSWNYYVVDIPSHIAESGIKFQSKYLFSLRHLATNSDFLIDWFSLVWFGLVLLHINHYRLFDSKSYLFIYIRYIGFANISQQSWIIPSIAMYH